MQELEQLSNFILQYFSFFDLGVLSINLLILLFAKSLVELYPYQMDEKSVLARVWMIRFTCFVLMIAFATALILEITIAHQISQTALTIFGAYITIHVGQAWSTNKYGREREVDEQLIRSDTITSESISMILFVLVFAFALLVILNIWDLKSWLQTTSVLGGLLIAIFTTKDYWLGDIISSFMLLRNEQIQPGAVIKVDSMQLLGVIKMISLSQTIVKDLVQKHDIIIPNTLLRQSKLEILTSSTERGLPDYVDFKIGYGVATDVVETFLEQVWDQACNDISAINAEVKPRIQLIENGDHAVTWRLFYNVKNVFNLIGTRNGINKTAYQLSLEENLPLNTPLTYQAVS